MQQKNVFLLLVLFLAPLKGSQQNSLCGVSRYNPRLTLDNGNTGPLQENIEESLSQPKNEEPLTSIQGQKKPFPYILDAWIVLHKFAIKQRDKERFCYFLNTYKFNWSVYYKVDKVFCPYDQKIVDSLEGFLFIHYLAITEGCEEMFKCVVQRYPNLINKRILNGNSKLSGFTVVQLLLLIGKKDLVDFLFTDDTIKLKASRSLLEGCSERSMSKISTLYDEKMIDSLQGFLFIHYLAIAEGCEEMFKCVVHYYPNLVNGRILAGNRNLGLVNVVQLLLLIGKKDLVDFLFTEKEIKGKALQSLLEECDTKSMGIMVYDQRIVYSLEGFLFIHCLAIMEGCEEIFKYLVRYYPNLVNLRILAGNLRGVNVLQLLFIAEKYDLVKFLLMEAIRHIAVKDFSRKYYHIKDIPESIQDLIIQYVGKPDYSSKRVSVSNPLYSDYSLLRLAAEHMNRGLIEVLQKHYKLLARGRKEIEEATKAMRKVAEKERMIFGYEDEFNPLINAIIEKKDHYAMILFKKDPSLAQKERKVEPFKGYTAIEIALLRNRVAIFVFLLYSEKNRSLLRKKIQRKGEYYLLNLLQFLVASIYNGAKLIDPLLEYCPELATEVVEEGQKNYEHLNALHIAIILRKNIIVKKLIEKAPYCIKKVEKGKYQGMNIIHMAIVKKFNIRDILKYLSYDKDRSLALIREKVGNDKDYKNKNTLELALETRDQDWACELLAHDPLSGFLVLQDPTSKYYTLKKRQTSNYQAFMDMMMGVKIVQAVCSTWSQQPNIEKSILALIVKYYEEHTIEKNEEQDTIDDIYI